MTPHQETLTLAARKLDAAWGRYIEADGEDGEEFERVAEAIGDIRAALDGREFAELMALREELVGRTVALVAEGERDHETQELVPARRQVPESAGEQCA